MGQNRAVKVGWFSVKGRIGDRTIDEQMTGLDQLVAECKGKTVLDVGCAEGLMSIKLARAGALAVHGIEIVPGHVEFGRRLVKDAPVTLEVQDANDWQPKRQYDIVIMLALLQKLRNPTAACARYAAAARDLVVIRLPPLHAPTIIDDRSYGNPHHIGETMEKAGFTLERSGYDGPRAEWQGFWRRNKD